MDPSGSFFLIYVFLLFLPLRDSHLRETLKKSSCVYLCVSDHHVYLKVRRVSSIIICMESCTHVLVYVFGLGDLIYFIQRSFVVDYVRDQESRRVLISCCSYPKKAVSKSSATKDQKLCWKLCR